MRGLFITGTDTGVGKTIVAAGIVRRLRARGFDAVPMKPVQTGCARRADGSLDAPDLEFVLRAAGMTATEEEAALMCPYRYEPACSPHLAGRMAGREVKIGDIVKCAEKVRSAECGMRNQNERRVLVVEGAGGVMVPIDEIETMVDLMRRLGLPVVVVARAGLGTINHTLLTVGALRGAGMTVAGVVFNRTEAGGEADAFICEDNAATIARLGAVTILGCLPWLPGLTSGSAAGDWELVDRELAGLDRLMPE
jgi:dethiobiotin synthase